MRRVSVFVGLVLILVCAIESKSSAETNTNQAGSTLGEEDCKRLAKERDYRDWFQSDEYKQCNETRKQKRKSTSEAREAEREATRVKFIEEQAKLSPENRKYRQAALNKEVVIGMPQAMFDLAAWTWNCEPNITETARGYRTQHVCTGAFSKSRELQGHYFYTEGKVVVHKGEKVYAGKVTAIQNQ